MQCTNVDKLELHGCQAENWEQNDFAGGKSASFPLVRSFRQSNRNSKGSEEKKGKLQRGGGVNDFLIQRAWEG